jgi:HEAT repeat protein
MGPTAKAAVPNLVELVQEPTEKIRLEAIWALASIGPAARPAVTVLTEAAGDKDLVIRHAATHALRQIGPPAVPALLHLLDDDDPQTRRKVVEALGRSVSRSQVVCGALALHAVDEDAGVRAAAFAALSLKGHDAVHHLESLMQNEDPTARSQAAMSLCRMGVNAQMATPTLLGALNDENANVRFWALRALAALALERTAEHDQVHSTLDDPDPDVRWQAIDTINRAGIREAGFVVHQRHDRQNR